VREQPYRITVSARTLQISRAGDTVIISFKRDESA